MERLPAETHRSKTTPQDRACPARTRKPRADGGAVLILSKHPASKGTSPGTRPTCPILAVPSRPARLFADPLGTDDLAPFFSKPCFLQAERANSAARRRMEQIRRTANAEGMLHSGNTIVAVSKTVHENFRTTLGWLCRFAFEATPEAEPEKVDHLDNVASALAREHLTILERLPVRLGSGWTRQVRWELERVAVANGGLCGSGTSSTLMVQNGSVW